MIDIKYNIRTSIKPDTQQVKILVRWNKKKYETAFIPGVYADPEKWDNDAQKAKKGTTHIVRSNHYSASDINGIVSDYKQEIELAFNSFALSNTIPTPSQLKETVNKRLDRNQKMTESVKPVKKKSIDELLSDFLKEGEREKNWDKRAKEKYTQAVNHLKLAVPNVSIVRISYDTMIKLRDWYVSNGYKNRTISKQLVMLKAFLRWVNEQPGYSIPDKALNFDSHLKVVKKTVTFLNYDELMQFVDFKFSKPHLSLARDLWCFMAFTSLRYSDLANLMLGHIVDNRIDMVTQKTADRISIPLTDGAQKILNRYKDTPTADGHVFNVLSNQKMNTNIKEAAREAGLNRMIVDTFFTGTERKEEQKPFHDIISCHDARRTFVSCSLAMGIPPQVVMKATEHKTYKTMQPYIDTATETQTLEMEKWNKNQYRSQIITLFDTFSEEKLKLALDQLKAMD